MYHTYKQPHMLSCSAHRKVLEAIHPETFLDKTVVLSQVGVSMAVDLHLHAVCIHNKPLPVLLQCNYTTAATRIIIVMA